MNFMESVFKLIIWNLYNYINFQCLYEWLYNFEWDQTKIQTFLFFTVLCVSQRRKTSQIERKTRSLQANIFNLDPLKRQNLFTSYIRWYPTSPCFPFSIFILARSRNVPSELWSPSIERLRAVACFEGLNAWLGIRILRDVTRGRTKCRIM